MLLPSFSAIFALLLAGALHAQEPVYVGSRTCAECHREIYESYVRTGMGLSMQPAVDLSLPAPAELDQPGVRRRFRVFLRGKDLWQSECGFDRAGNKLFEDTHKLEFAIGSGVNGFSFVVRRGNYLFEAPLSYYSNRARWELSPGYESADLGFSRAIPAACTGCHSGRARAVEGREGLFDDPPFAELAIGCENCHGPGAAHVARPMPGTIANPAKWPPRLAEEICIMCHQGGDARVLQPGRKDLDFRPGMWSNGILAIFKLPSSEPERSDLLEHHAAMHASRCFRASAGKLGCLTCHNPHLSPARSEAAAYYRSKCLTCHTDRSCGAPQAERRARAADDCTSCHMPKREVTLVTHAALTNHRIPARPDRQTLRESAATGDLIQVNAPPDPRPIPALTLLRAYGRVAAKRPDFESRYLALLDQLSHTQPDDPAVLEALGRKAMFDPDPDASRRARKYLEKAIANGSTSPSTFQDLAEVLTRGGRRDEAVAVLEKGLAMSPYAPDLYRSLARNYTALGRRAEARKTLARYLELFPQDDAARRSLR
jgi:predicted CXXCH cytochrome family protein